MFIFGAPTYMGSPSAQFKAFAEATSKVRADNLRWKDKIAAGFTNSQAINGDKLNSLMAFRHPRRPTRHASGQRGSVQRS